MASRLKKFWQYQQSVANICRKLIELPPKPAAVVLQYIPKPVTRIDQSIYFDKQ